jgi:hypothetical protein
MITVSQKVPRRPTLSRKGEATIALVAAVAQTLFVWAALALVGEELLVSAHDGKFYLDSVTDPFLLNPATVADWGDISYWGLRIGYPLLGWPLQLLLEPFQALVVVNAIAAAIGSVWAGRLAVDAGKAYWWGLVLAINPATFFAAVLLLPDTVAYAAVIGCLLAASRRRWVLAALAALLAVATKEASLAPLALAALVYLRRSERRAIWLIVVPIIWHVSWAINLISRYDGLQSADFITWPFLGYVEAATRVWFATQPTHVGFYVAIAMLILAAVAVVAFRKRPTPVLAAAAGAGLIYPFMDWEVLYTLSNIPRIGGWIFPLLAVGWERIPVYEPYRDQV